MKKTLFLAIFSVLLLSGGAARAAGPFGPPADAADQDSDLFGIGFFSNSTTWKASGGKGKIESTQQQAFVQLTIPGSFLSGDGAFFARLGGATFDDGRGFEGDPAPTISLGLWNVLYGERRGDLRVGAVVQGSYCPGYKSDKSFPRGDRVIAKVRSIWDVSLGVAAEKEVRDGFVVYGGPSLDFTRAGISYSEGYQPPDVNLKGSGLLGLFAGGRISLGKRFRVGAEGQYRNDGFSAGAVVLCVF